MSLSYVIIFKLISMGRDFFVGQEGEDLLLGNGNSQK